MLQVCASTWGGKVSWTLGRGGGRNKAGNPELLVFLVVRDQPFQETLELDFFSISSDAFLAPLS